MKKKQISDYLWIAKGRKYWHVFIGNPFYCTEETWPTARWSETSVEAEALKVYRQCQSRFKNQYPEVPWK